MSNHMCTEIAQLYINLLEELRSTFDYKFITNLLMTKATELEPNLTEEQILVIIRYAYTNGVKAFNKSINEKIRIAKAISNSEEDYKNKEKLLEQTNKKRLTKLGGVKQ